MTNPESQAHDLSPEAEESIRAAAIRMVDTARVSAAANPHHADWWDGVASHVTAALERAAEHLDDPFAETMASVGCDVAHEAYCAGWSAAAVAIRDRVFDCQVVVQLPYVPDTATAAVLISDLVAIFSEAGAL